MSPELELNLPLKKILNLVAVLVLVLLVQLVQLLLDGEPLPPLPYLPPDHTDTNYPPNDDNRTASPSLDATLPVGITQ